MSETQAEARQTWHPQRYGILKTVLLVALVLAAVAFVIAAWGLLPLHAVSTENAYVRGRTTIVSPQVSGYVAQVPVRDYQRVRKGQLLVQIDDSIYRARVAQAKANLSAAKASLANNRQARASGVAALGGQSANLDRARADMTRDDDLVKQGAVSARQRDLTWASLAQATAANEVARQNVLTVDVGRGGLIAGVEAAEAQLRLAEIDLEHTTIRAPETGQLGEVGVRLGQYVTNGTQLMALVPPDRWIIANFKEAQTANIRPGQQARITVDALDGQQVFGRVETLSPAAGSEFAVLKPDNATGNFVKVPQRIGVRISIDADPALVARLRPGMSVDIHINTGGRP